jgi:hypothetical protein
MNDIESPRLPWHFNLYRFAFNADGIEIHRRGWRLADWIGLFSAAADQHAHINRNETEPQELLYVSHFVPSEARESRAN